MIGCNDSFLQKMEFHINANVREKCDIKEELFSSTGNVIIQNVSEIHQFVYNFNRALDENQFEGAIQSVSYLKAGELNGMGLLDEIFHYVCRLYRKNIEPDFFQQAYKYIDDELLKKSESKTPLFDLLLIFCNEFPNVDVYNGMVSAKEWLTTVDEASGVENKFLALEELLLLRLANENPAFEPFGVLFNEEKLRNEKSFATFWFSFKRFAGTKGLFGPENTDLISMLKKPSEHSPFSIKGQLNYILENWKDYLGSWLSLLLEGIDLISEDEKMSWFGGDGNAETAVYEFGGEDSTLDEYERYSMDKDWMPNVVLLAKSTLVWLDQLSKKYKRPIQHLNEIPDEELSMIASQGFNSLWLIGLWERSKASAKIKQRCGNLEAAASAYSLNGYDISDELGGWDAFNTLKQKAKKYGIRLAADMVPNHTGMDSKWVIERPNLFLQVTECPFPAYKFESENLSDDPRVGVYLEDHYYSKEDCAVVFKRVDHYTGDVRYIYHGNDGTGLPWNDTAQLDFLNPETREAVIQEVINVARNFQIIRLDAAMVLAKKHIQRLWYPLPGSGGDVASRSRFSMSNEEFDRHIPQEFWRELVDRCTAELPDTLLLAEAFWMMEGYFVRTLGMHRVYNSAFMNMLKKEENEKYRATIKNTIEFDKQVLKRYVNFMNNPDEDTAIAQFGSGDKYFGVCTMMATMPGLPMFGHGQIEGFTEKYGMEYKKAYYDELPNTELVERHKREIFPLLKKRWMFSDVENFYLFDFWNNNLINENVFVWSNYCNGKRSLVFYNNTYERAFGWIQHSVAYAVKGENDEKYLEKTRLLPALQLTASENYYTMFCEQKTGLWYIRNNKELNESGFYAGLEGFQSQVFWEIYEVEDNANGDYEKLYNKLNGKGIDSIEYGIKGITFRKIHKATTSLLCKAYFVKLVNLIKSENSKNMHIPLEKDIDEFLEDVKNPTLAFFTAVMEEINENPEYDLQLDSETVETASKYFICAVKKIVYLGVNSKHIAANVSENAKDYVNVLVDEFLSSNKNITVYIIGMLLIALRNIIGNAELLISLLEKWGLDKKIVEIISGYGNDLEDAKELIYLIPHISSISCDKEKSVEKIIERLITIPKFQQYIKLHTWNNEQWFQQESAEMILFIIIFSKMFNKIKISDLNLDKFNIIEYYGKIYNQMHVLLTKSGYKITELLKLI